MNKKAGFTLVEMLITVAIIAILTSIAVPNFVRWRRDAQLRASADELLSTVQTAKIRAIKERAPVTVIITTGTNSYIAFIDDGAAGTGVPNDEVRNGNEQIIARGQMPGTVNVYSAIYAPGGVPRFTFGINGIPNRFGDVRIRNNPSTRFRMINLSATGFSKVRRSTDGINWQG